MAEKDFRDQLVEGVAKAEEKRVSGAKARGADTGSSESFKRKSERIEKRASQQNRLRLARSSFEKLARQVTTEAGLVDRVEQNKFNSKLKERAQSLEKMLLQRAGRLERQMARQGVEAEKRRRVMGALSSGAELLGTSIATGVGGGSGSKKSELSLGSTDLPDISKGLA